jgi:hypothetical protein
LPDEDRNSSGNEEGREEAEKDMFSCIILEKKKGFCESVLDP